MESQNNSSNSSESGPEYSSRRGSRRAARRERFEERRESRRSRYGNSWVGGAVLILIGVFVMLRNLSLFSLENWWALFILIPALGAFGNAWRAYQNDGRLSAPARASLVSGFILAMVTAVFLFELNWMILGPVLLILAGVGLLINVVLPG